MATDKNGNPIRLRARVRMEGIVERVGGEGVFVRVAPGLVEYVSPEAVEVLPDRVSVPPDSHRVHPEVPDK